MSDRESLEGSAESLATQFKNILQIWDDLDTTSLSQISPEYQKKVNDAIEKLENMTRTVSLLGLFSSNEDIEEVSTENLRYLLLPALLADFSLRTQKHNRIEMLEHAKVYYRDFIKRLNEYNVCDYKLDKDDDEEEEEESKESSSSKVPLQAGRSETEALINASIFRKNKIERYGEVKKVQEEMRMLKQEIVDKEESGTNVDEDTLRRFHLTLISVWINRAIDDLAFVEMEMPIIKMRASIMAQQIPEPRHPKPKALPPIIITKDRLQKEVFGLGYPAVPTCTIEEFIEGKLDDGSLAFEKDKKVYDNSLYNWANDPEAKKDQDEIGEEMLEKLIENDDEDELRRMRQKDDWKDDHKRGEGNRYRMG